MLKSNILKDRMYNLNTLIWYCFDLYNEIIYPTKKALSAVNCIGGVMVSMLASSVEDHGFEPQWGQTKLYCLPFRSTWVHPQFLVGFVLLDL